MKRQESFRLLHGCSGAVGVLLLVPNLLHSHPLVDNGVHRED